MTFYGNQKLLYTRIYMKKNINDYKEVELIRANYKLKQKHTNNVDSIDNIIENLLDNIYYYESEYNYYVRILDVLYKKYDTYVEMNKQKPNLLLCENIVVIEKKILLCEKIFVNIIGKLSRTKLKLELTIHKYYE